MLRWRCPGIKKPIVDEVRRLNRDAGVTVLVVSHEMDTVRSLCDELVVMVRGELLTQGKHGDVIRDPRVIDAYLGRPQEPSR